MVIETTLAGITASLREWSLIGRLGEHDGSGGRWKPAGVQHT